jgi:DNA-directed RNA polymerase subunit RPC12/RpoP
MSDAGKCPFDGAEISAGRWICMDCERQLKSNLEYLRDHIDDLIEVANKQARPGPLDLAKGTHSSPSSAPLPVRTDAWEQCQAIGTWAHQAVAGHSVMVSLSVMALHTRDLTRNRTIPILAAQAKEHQRKMQGILDWENEKRRGGKCMECGTVLWVLDESQYAICGHCGALNDLAETRAIQRDEIINSYKEGTSREVASTLTQCGWPITARSIRRYAAKGLVNPGQGTDGKSLYNVGEIIHLIEHNIPA